LLARDYRADWDYDETGLQASGRKADFMASALTGVEPAAPDEAWRVASTAPAGGRPLASLLQDGFDLNAAVDGLLSLAANGGDVMHKPAARTLATTVFGLTLAS
jgi:hypothetical protein